MLNLSRSQYFLIAALGGAFSVWLWRHKHPIWAAFFGLGALSNLLMATREPAPHDPSVRAST